MGILLVNHWVEWIEGFTFSSLDKSDQANSGIPLEQPKYDQINCNRHLAGR